MLKLTAFLFVFLPVISFSQAKITKLSIEKIMSDPKWIGTSPSNPFWSADGTKLFFDWNPDKAPSDSLYFITLENKTPIKASVTEKQQVVPINSVTYDLERNAYVYQHDGDIFYHDIRTNRTRQVTQTEGSEHDPQFSFGSQKIVYNLNQNLYSWDISSGQTVQLTNFNSGKDDEEKTVLSPEDQWLKKDQLEYMEVLKKRKHDKDLADLYDSTTKVKGLMKIYLEGQRIQGISISPDGRFVNYSLYQPAGKRINTIVPDYITESGFTTDISGRPKVGEPQGSSRFFIYDRKEDSIIEIKPDSLPGIRDLPEYVKEYPAELAERKKKNEIRKIGFTLASWSPLGGSLLMDIYSTDHKDRWLVKWDAQSQQLKVIDRQHDEAWIGGPEIWNSGWIDENTCWYMSEATGYAHLYSQNVISGKKTAYTSGKYEVLDAKLSKDKKYFYISTNEVEPAQHQFYRLRLTDKKTERITTMTGGNEVTLSPDEKSIAILYSYTNKPWELYLQENKPGGKIEKITTKAQSEEFKSYPWRDPEIITFTARDGAIVHGRIYKPSKPDIHKPAVLFVHGAGYLQNIDKWWSYYFREFMFNNLLADNGYYVMDIDYRGSAGYGRDWRTAIYRHMGGKDLDDHVDAAAYLVKNFGVDPNRIGIYGGSYGGFITLMAMFTTPDVFAAGAGIRSVSDWANYNHGYTSEILNEPYNDSLAYKRSSPIYYVSGLKGHLLMCHGMIDQNVHFQDIVKVTQRLIELGKNNWELAPYPLEDHDFKEPSSWTDEYKRIYHLFEEVLKK